MSLGAAERLVELGSDHLGGVGGGRCNNGKPVSMQYLILINNQWNTLIPTWYLPDLIGEGVIGSQHSKQSGHPVGQQASKQKELPAKLRVTPKLSNGWLLYQLCFKVTLKSPKFGLGTLNFWQQCAYTEKWQTK